MDQTKGQLGDVMAYTQKSMLEVPTGSLMFMWMERLHVKGKIVEISCDMMIQGKRLRTYLLICTKT